MDIIDQILDALDRENDIIPRLTQRAEKNDKTWILRKFCTDVARSLRLSIREPGQEAFEHEAIDGAEKRQMLDDGEKPAHLSLVNASSVRTCSNVHIPVPRSCGRATASGDRVSSSESQQVALDQYTGVEDDNGSVSTAYDGPLKRKNGASSLTCHSSMGATGQCTRELSGQIASRTLRDQEQKTFERAHCDSCGEGARKKRRPESHDKTLNIYWTVGDTLSENDSTPFSGSPKVTQGVGPSPRHRLPQPTSNGRSDKKHRWEVYVQSLPRAKRGYAIDLFQRLEYHARDFKGLWTFESRAGQQRSYTTPPHPTYVKALAIDSSSTKMKLRRLLALIFLRYQYDYYKRYGVRIDNGSRLERAEEAATRLILGDLLTDDTSKKTFHQALKHGRIYEDLIRVSIASVPRLAEIPCGEQGHISASAVKTIWDYIAQEDEENIENQMQQGFDILIAAAKHLQVDIPTLVSNSNETMLSRALRSCQEQCESLAKRASGNRDKEMDSTDDSRYQTDCLTWDDPGLPLLLSPGDHEAIANVDAIYNQLYHDATNYGTHNTQTLGQMLSDGATCTSTTTPTTHAAADAFALPSSNEPDYATYGQLYQEAINYGAHSTHFPETLPTEPNITSQYFKLLQDAASYGLDVIQIPEQTHRDPCLLPTI